MVGAQDPLPHGAHSRPPCGTQIGDERYQTRKTTMTKIAIVGSGISGLMAAYTLSPRHEVELFESNHRAGGHANTVLVNDVGTPTPVDTGHRI